MGPELARLLSDLRPAELALRDWVRSRLDAGIVRQLADLDYGMQVDEHRRAIEALKVAQRLPAELSWTPREVLELSSYGDPDDPRRRSSPTGSRGHVARLFSCLVLIRADDALTPAGTLAALVESALALGPEATEDAIRYLAWCRLHEPGAWRDDAVARSFLTLGLLLLYVASPGRGDAAVAAALARAFVDEVEAAESEDQHSWPGKTSALLKKVAGADGWRTWRALAARCLIDGTASGGGSSRPAIPGQTMALDTVRTWLRVD